MSGIRKALFNWQHEEYPIFLAMLGPTLRRWRVIRRLTLTGLASMVGCTNVFLSYVERGKRSLSLEMAYQICIVLDIPLSTLTPALRVKLAAKKPVRRKAVKIPLRSEVVRDRAASAKRKTLAA